MKKIIKISIGVVLLLMVSASFVYAAPFTWTNEVGGIKTTPVSVTTSDGNTTVSMNAIKPDGDAENVTFILTIYNKITKRLENVKMQTLLVGNTLTSFSFENIPGITANHEINTSIVSLANKFMPMGMPMNMPANEDAVNLKD